MKIRQSLAAGLLVASIAVVGIGSPAGAATQVCGGAAERTANTTISYKGTCTATQARIDRYMGAGQLNSYYGLVGSTSKITSNLGNSSGWAFRSKYGASWTTNWMYF